MPVVPILLRLARARVLTGFLLFSLAGTTASIADGDPTAVPGPATAPPPALPGPVTASPPPLPGPVTDPIPPLLETAPPPPLPGPVTKPPSPPPGPVTEPIPPLPETAPPPPLPGPVTEPPPPLPGPVTAPNPFGEPPKIGYLQAIGQKMEAAHARLEENLLRQIIRFDDFFGRVRTTNLREVRYDFRLINSLRIDRGGSLKYGPGLRTSLTLSKISERLTLSLAGERTAEPTTSQSLPQDPGRPGYDRTVPTTHFANTELRYELVQKPELNLFLGAGVRIRLPLEAFVRSRFQYNHHLGQFSLFQFAETFFVKNSDFLGETTEITIDRAFGPNLLLRWASSGTASEEINGLEWGSELSMLKQLSPRRAITLTGGVYGNTAFADMVQNYRLFAVYRQNFLRSWLFYEVQPEVSWPRSADGNLPAKLAITFRLEVAFRGSRVSSD